MEPQCNEFRASVNVKVKKNRNKNANLYKSHAFLEFFYATYEYQEIKHEKDFGGEDLWSGIGGFIGMFAGYGLLQVLTDGLNWAIIGMTTRSLNRQVRPDRNRIEDNSN